MSDKIHDVPAEWAKRAHVDAAKYRDMYARSIKDPNAFWAEEAKRIHWYRPPSKIKRTSFGPGEVSIKWFEDGVTNIAYNCIDRHLAKRANQTAIIWEGDDPSQSKHITYRELHAEVCRMANALKELGVKKGDRVTIYLPMIPEAAYAMLGCARIGAVHSVVFAGFSPDSLAGRILDCQSEIVVTADEGLRGGKTVPLKRNTDQALTQCPDVRRVIVVRRTGAQEPMKPGRDVWYHEEAAKASDQCAPEEMGAEDPLFILYTSGSTGKPKGVLHTSAGYLCYAAFTHKYVFDYHSDGSGGALRRARGARPCHAGHPGRRPHRDGRAQRAKRSLGAQPRQSGSGLPERREQRRGATRQRIGLGEIAGLVGTDQECPVADMEDHRGNDVGPDFGPWHFDEGQREQRGKAHAERHQRDRQEAVEMYLDQCVPDRMHGRRGEHGEEDEQRHGGLIDLCGPNGVSRSISTLSGK